MSKPLKFGAVLAGYAAALLLAGTASYVRGFWIPDDPASGGMQAYGDAIFFLGMFGFLALAPTALALYFLRLSATFWRALTVAALALAASGPVAAAMIRHPAESGWAALAGVFGLHRVLGAPLLCLGFLTGALIAPTQGPRLALLGAAVLEVVVSAYAFFCLIVLGHWLL